MLVNTDAEAVSELPNRDATDVDDVAELINAGADFHKAINAVEDGSLVTEQDDGTISGFVQLRDTTAYAAGQAAKLLRAMGANVDRTPGATRDGKVWFTLDVETPQCPNCQGTDLKDGVCTNELKTFDFGCRDCRAVFDKDSPTVFGGSQ